jgi:uncharacterized protein (DUF58 family)
LEPEHRDQWVEDAIDLTASLLVEAHARGLAVGLEVAGLAEVSFAPRHSQPHRDAMLRALAMLDMHQAQPAHRPRKRTGTASLTIVPGPPDAQADPRVLASCDLATFVLGPARAALSAVGASGAVPPLPGDRAHRRPAAAEVRT